MLTHNMNNECGCAIAAWEYKIAIDKHNKLPQNL